MKDVQGQLCVGICVGLHAKQHMKIIDMHQWCAGNILTPAWCHAGVPCKQLLTPAVLGWSDMLQCMRGFGEWECSGGQLFCVSITQCLEIAMQPAESTRCVQRVLRRPALVF